MKALVVYESLFGNTEEVARAIASGLSEHLDVDVAEVTRASATFAEPLDLIVVGAKGAARHVRKLGYSAVAEAERFYVDDVSGPLLEGELDRARAWGERLGGQAPIRAAEGAHS